MLNEAALLTARTNQKMITNETLDEAIDRVIAGPQRRTRLMSEKEKLITAYHEGGHALVAAALPGTDPVHKVTILPRGRALGYTMVLPDRTSTPRPARRCSTSSPTCWAAGPRRRWSSTTRPPAPATTSRRPPSLARAMVTQYGMTERLGAIKLGDGNAEPFLGRDIGHSRNYSEEVAAIVDEETKKLLATAHQEAFDILEENRDVLDSLVLALLDKETLDKEQIAEIFEPLRRRPERPAWTGSPDRRPVDDPAGRDPAGDPRPASGVNGCEPPRSRRPRRC